MRKATRGRLGPRTADTYDNELHGKSESSMPPGDRTINESASVNMIRPRHKEGPLVFQPFPALDFERPDSRFQPCRKSANPHGQSPWMVRLAAAKYVGLEGSQMTFNLYLPTEKDSRKDNPYVIFYRACDAGFKGNDYASGGSWKSSWNRLMMSNKKGGAAISKPTTLWYWQGAVYRNADRFFVDQERVHPLGLDPKDKLTVIQASSSAGDGLMELCDTRRDEYEGDVAKDPSVAFLYNPVGRLDKRTGEIKGGLFVTIYNPKKTNITKRTSWDGTFPQGGIQGYEAAVSRRWKHGREVYEAGFSAEQVEQIFAKACFWFDDKKTGDPGVIRVASFEQQALWIAQAFAGVPQLVQYAWRDNREYLTDEVKGILKARASAVIPGKDAEEDEDDGEDERRPSRRRGKDLTQRSLFAKRDEEDEEDEEDDEDEPRRSRSKSKTKAKSRGRSRDDDDEEDEEDEYDLDDEDDDDLDDDEDDDDLDDEDDDDRPAKKTSGKSTKKAPGKSAKKSSGASAGKKTSGKSTEGLPELDEYEKTYESDKAKSTQAMKDAKARSAKRSEPPQKEAPKPPKSGKSSSAKAAPASKKSTGKKSSKKGR